MTSGRVHIIFAGEYTWRLGLMVDDQPQTVTINLEKDDSPDNEYSLDNIADTIAQTLTEHGYANEELVLAIPSNWCLCASLPTDNLPTGKDRRQSLIYRLEEHLPIPAEQFTADFTDPNNKSNTLGVCVDTDRIKPIINALEQRDIQIQSVCPLGLLAIQSINTTQSNNNDDSPTTLTSPDAVLWQNCQHLELVTLTDTQPTAWHLIKQSDIPTIKRLLTLHTLQTGRLPLNVQLRDVDDTTVDDIRKLPEVEVATQTDSPMFQAATIAAQQMLQSKLNPGVDLRRDQLAATDKLRSIRKPLNALIIAGLCLLACLSITLHWRAGQYQQLTRQNESQLATIFRNTLPKQSVSFGAIPSRLQAEYKSLRGLSGASADLPTQTSAYHLLIETLDRLPDKLRFRILNIDITPTRIRMAGQARSHSDAAAISSALGKANNTYHFKVDQPRTEKRRQQGVNFTITVKVTTQPQTNGGKP